MSAPDPLPTYLYKIHLPLDNDHDPTTALSGLDKSSGYIHLSTVEQIPITAARFFTAHSTLLVQKLQVDQIGTKGGELKWEEADGEVYPHWYVDPMELALVGMGEVLKFEKEDGKEWEQVFGDKLE